MLPSNALIVLKFSSTKFLRAYICMYFSSSNVAFILDAFNEEKTQNHDGAFSYSNTSILKGLTQIPSIIRGENRIHFESTLFFIFIYTIFDGLV